MPLQDVLFPRTPAEIAAQAAEAAAKTAEATAATRSELRSLREDVGDWQEVQSVELATGLDSVAGATAAVSRSIDTLSHSVREGFEAVISTIASQTSALLTRLDAPRRTAAIELKERAIGAAARSWSDQRWADAAITDLTEAAALEPYDFEIHWYLGILYAFRKLDDEKAHSAFDTAAAFAYPDYPRASAAALLAKAMVDAANGRYAEARDAADLAVGRDPALAVAHFDLGRYAAVTSGCDRAISEIVAAIRLDPAYFDRARVADELRWCGDLTAVLAELKEAARVALVGLVRTGKYCLEPRAAILARLHRDAALAGHHEELRGAEQVAPGQSYVDLRQQADRLADFASRVVAAVEAELEAARERVGEPDSEPERGSGVILSFLWGGLALALAVFPISFVAYALALILLSLPVYLLEGRDWFEEAGSDPSRSWLLLLPAVVVWFLFGLYSWRASEPERKAHREWRDREQKRFATMTAIRAAEASLRALPGCQPVGSQVVDVPRDP